MIHNVLIVAAAIAAVLFVWFRTHAWVEYVSLTKWTKKWFLINKWLEWRQVKIEEAINNNIQPQTIQWKLSYLDFINQTYPENFFVKLLSCPFCFGFWLSVFFSVVYCFAPFVVEIFAAYSIGVLIYFGIKKMVEK